MKRICILSSVHPALDNRIFYREAQSLQKAGFKVTVIAIHDKNEVRDNIQIIALPRLPRWQRPFLWFKLLQQAFAQNADVFHFHDPELLLIAPLLRLFTKKPSIYDIHESLADFVSIKLYIPASVRRPLSKFIRWIEPILARLQSGLIFADDQIADTFQHIQCPKTTLFNYPANSFVKEASVHAPCFNHQKPTILHLGTHEKSRGASLMIAAFHQVLQVVPEANLLMVGPFFPPDYEQEIKNDISQRKIESAITLTGRVPFQSVTNYLKQADIGWVALQPVAKYQKNIPTKLFEYMAYGIPIVNSNLTPSQAFVKDGENGRMVQADNPNAHAQAIIDLIANPQAALAMGKKNQILVKTVYNWDEMEKRLLMLYKQLLEEK